MEVRAHIKNVRMSPIKLRTLIDSLKAVSPSMALDQLGLSQKRNAKALYQALKSAISNGQAVPGFDPKKATFKVLSIDEGRSLKRYRAGSRGMARPFVRKSSHITVVLEQKGLENTPKPVKVKTAQSKDSSKTSDKAVMPALEAVQPAKASKQVKMAKPTKQANKSVTNTQRTTNK